MTDAELRALAEAAAAEIIESKPTQSKRDFRAATTPTSVLGLLDRLEAAEQALAQISNICGESPEDPCGGCKDRQLIARAWLDKRGSGAKRSGGGS